MFSITPYVFAAVFAFLSSCATLPSSAILQFDEGQIEYISMGTGSPVVVFESGMGQRMKTWRYVFPEVSEFTRAFAYNRSGYGTSVMMSRPRKARDVVEQLRRTLRAAGNAPPYVLVGHSIGGIFINLFARMYPEEVAGVVFIEANHPDLFAYMREEDRIWYTLLLWYSSLGRTGYERRIIRNVKKEFAGAPPFPDIPVIVLAAESTFSIFGSGKIRRKWLNFQKDLSQISSESQYRKIRGSGHMIHWNQPEEVIQAIRELVATGVRLEN